MDNMGDFAGLGIDLNGFYGGGYSGDQNMGGAVGVPVPVYGDEPMPGDWADAQAMNPWNPAPAKAAGAPWWAGVAAYGITKAIDNQFPGSPTGIQGNTYPGSGASAAGRTYTLRPNGAGGGTSRAGPGQRTGAANGFTASPLLLLLLGAGAIYALKG